MKKLTLILIVILFSSCMEESDGLIIIRSKTHFTYVGNPMPEGICRYFYRPNNRRNSIEFSDKCDKYNVGDTIIGVRR